MKNNSHQFWVVNISDRNVCLTDLAVTIPARTSRNLLGKKPQHTLEQLEASAKSGSIFAKSDKIKVRNIPPKQMVTPGIQTMKSYRLGKNRSMIEVVEKRYEELDLPDELFIEEFIDSELNPTSEKK